MSAPQHIGMQLNSDFKKQIPAIGYTQNNDSLPDLSDEFKYYFDRHNVMDEGYEMVAAFANGKRLEIAPARRLTIWNVGSWQGRTREGTALDVDSAGFTIC